MICRMDLRWRESRAGNRWEAAFGECEATEVRLVVVLRSIPCSSSCSSEQMSWLWHIQNIQNQLNRLQSTWRKKALLSSWALQPLTSPTGPFSRHFGKQSRGEYYITSCLTKGSTNIHTAHPGQLQSMYSSHVFWVWPLGFQNCSHIGTPSCLRPVPSGSAQ